MPSRSRARTPASCRFAGTDGRCDKIGAGLTDGEIIVDGDAGAYLGAGMKRGKIEVNGNRRRAGRRQHGRRRIAIAGDADERAGGIMVGETMGMKGGVLTIGGNAGAVARRAHAARAGDRRRRCRGLCRRRA